ncbi:MAG: murein L,D-transpeptidase [Chitinophagaceae bacterium]|nr:MAG: murein L,D-transpeptidase [Chitinophagaceae bacterium]
MSRILNLVLCLSLSILITRCTQPDSPASTGSSAARKEARKEKEKISYRIDSTKKLLDTLKKNNDIARIVAAVNRTDYRHLLTMDSIIVPNELNQAIEDYLPFPLKVPYLKDVDKIVYFSYPTQTFAAYEFGELAYTGQTNMGRKADPTPQKLYFTNWKAEETTSTFNDEWDLKWNFNIENKEGIGWHQYELPGYPASHSCLRMTERDAKFMYDWADQWKLQGTDNVIAKGIPTIVFGTYNFDGPKPWLQLPANPLALDIKAGDIERETAAYLPEILKEQKNRLAQKNSE